MNINIPNQQSKVLAGQSWTANLVIGTSPMVIPTTNNTGCFTITAQGSVGPNVVAIITKSVDSLPGDIAIISGSNDANGNFFDILWPENSRPTISCTTQIATQLFVSNGGVTNIAIQAAGPFSLRANYNTKPEGFTFFDDTNKCFYMRSTATSGVWTDPLYFPAKSDGERTAVQVITSTPTDVVFTDTTGNFMLFVSCDNGPSAVFCISKGIVTDVGDMMALSSTPVGANYLSLSWAANSKPQISFASTVQARINVTAGGYYPPTRDEVIKYIWAFVD
jgi:hypothetical protein